VDSLAEIHLGTSAFTAAGWEGSFYPKAMKSGDYLAFYSRKFDTVEVDSTFYACPSPQTVTGWVRKTPRDFVFSVKVPQVITHEKILVDCRAEFEQFVDTMTGLGEKLGPMVLQFPFFDRGIFKTQIDFLDRLIPFLRTLPHGYRFAVEIRNSEWLDSQLAAVLRDFGVALVLQDQSWMPLPGELSRKFDPITANWTYIRWLGDRKGIEKITKTWAKPVIDRTTEMNNWVDVCYETVQRGVTCYGYANNHYAGHAPATIQQFRNLWSAKGLPALWQPSRESSAPTLFDL
jgi:uncharacterized protein YecE (DUF72 family)